MRKRNEREQGIEQSKRTKRKEGGKLEKKRINFWFDVILRAEVALLLILV